MNEVKIVLVGTGGYGVTYLESLLNGASEYSYKLVGTVEPYPGNGSDQEKLLELGIPNYVSLEEFYAVDQADLAIISSPIQFHCSQTCLALTHGSHVLCEKPLSATIKDAWKMIEARDRTDKFVSIGYQWSFSKGIQDLKRDILNGLFGKPIRLRTIVLGPRSEKYYARQWAGKKQDSQGNKIFDSVANNATAHYIHNMFYILGSEINQSAVLSRVTAELYRANPIENFDTAAMRAFTDTGVELMYYGSHAVNEQVGVHFHYEFEKASIYFDNNPDAIVAIFHNGEKRKYHNPNNGDNKLRASIAAVHRIGHNHCSIEAAMTHTYCIQAMQQSTVEINEFPEAIVKRNSIIWNNEKGNYVEGLVEQMKSCYEKGILPAEAGFMWAREGKEIKI